MAAEHTRPAAASDSTSAPSGVLTYDADGFRYAYQVITGREALFDMRADPRQIHNLARGRASLTRELRQALESRLRVNSLDDLRSRYANSIQTLQSLGYL